MIVHTVRGFTLVEVMVVSAVMLIVIMGSSMFLLDMKKTQNKMESSSDLSSFKLHVRSSLENDITCGAALTGQSFQPSEGSVELEKIKLASGEELAAGVTLPNHRLHLNGMSLKNIPEQALGKDLAGSNVYTAELFMDFKTTRVVAGDGELGERMISQIYLGERDGKITRCGRSNFVFIAPPAPKDEPSADPSPNDERLPADIADQAQQVCKTVGGQWDAEKNVCNSALLEMGCKMLGGTMKDGQCEGAQAFDMNQLQELIK